MKRAWRVCPGIGCPNLTRGKQRYCDECVEKRRREQDAARPSSAARGYDRKWQAIRADYLSEHPFCVECGRPATQVHHVVRLEDGGSHDWTNLQAMCASCHSSHTAKEGNWGGSERR